MSTSVPSRPAGRKGAPKNQHASGAMPDIHPTAIVHPSALIADSAAIGPYVLIEENVRIGEGTLLESHNRVGCGARIGKNCKIGHGAVISSIPQDLKFEGEETELVIGDGTTVREFCTLNRGTKAAGKTIIGRNCLLMAYCHVAHDCVIGDNVILANGIQMGGHVEIQDFAIVGGMATIKQFARIGKHCMVGGGYRVNKDVPPFCLAGHEPLAFEGLNSIGLRRRGFSRETIETLDRLYLTLYRSGHNVSQAVEIIARDLPQTPEVRDILSFIAASMHGIIRASVS